jgi:hypothetical protein
VEFEVLPVVDEGGAALARTQQDIEQGKYPSEMLAAAVLSVIGSDALRRYAEADAVIEAMLARERGIT